HAKMLHAQGILSSDDYEAIVAGLAQVKDEIEAGEFVFDIADEDIHMAVEKRLSAIIGAAGGRLHTARSRNDQVALDFRLYTQKHNLVISNLLFTLIDTLVSIASKHKSTLLPGMTHLQHAQPISFAYHMLAYANMFKRDFDRFNSSYNRNDLSPLGCAALAGTPHKIDREFSARELGFSGVSANCLDTVSDRDFALEMLFNISTCMMHISRLCEEIIIWATSEFKFITLSDKHATGSSIMPQKKNPDIPELLRGKTGRVNGNLIALLTTLKGLTLAYNKDMQEDKEGVFDSVETMELSLKVLDEMMELMQVNKDNMQKATLIGHLSATDLADYMVSALNVPFRQAYNITGAAVNLADEKGVDLSKLSLEDLQSIDERIGEDVLQKLQLEASMNARDSLGATSVAQTTRQIEDLRRWMEAVKG
ncbi:MAG: argininosuccinate lyase, partial [Campylobacterota bacterium]